MCTAPTRSGQFVTRFTVACLQISLDVYGPYKKWTVCDPFHCGLLTDLPRCVRPLQEVDSLWPVSLWRAYRSSPSMCTAPTRSGQFVTRFTVACLQISLDVYGPYKKWTVCDPFHCGLLTDLPRCVRPLQEVDSLWPVSLWRAYRSP